jgi:hypothetical protein
MEVDLVEQRRHAHLLIDALSEDKLCAVNGLLDVLVEPLSNSLAKAPVEDEDLTPKTISDIQRANSSLNRGEGISHEDILREFSR